MPKVTSGGGHLPSLENLAASVNHRMRRAAERAGIRDDDPYAIVLDTQRETAVATLLAVEYDREDREQGLIELQRLVARIELAFQRVEDKIDRGWSKICFYTIIILAAFGLLAEIASPIHSSHVVGPNQGAHQITDTRPPECRLSIDDQGRLTATQCVVDVGPVETTR